MQGRNEPPYVAQDVRTRMHYVIRFADEATIRGRDRESTVELINELASAKRPKTIISAIARVGLVASGIGTSRQPKRIMTAKQLIDELAWDFDESDPEALACETYMFQTPAQYALSQGSANNSKRSTIAEFDAFKRGLGERLVLTDSDRRILIEPVQDWMTFRNMVSIGLCLIANIQCPPENGGIMQASGFRKVAANSGSAFVAPLKCDAWALAERSGKITQLDVDFLCERYRHALMSSRWGAHDGSSDSATNGELFIATREEARQRGIYLDSLDAMSGQRRLLYLCATFEGDQMAIAKTVFTALWSTCAGWQDANGDYLGLTIDPESLFDADSQSAQLVGLSLLSSAWYAVGFSGKPTICKRCGCGFLARNRGPAREFCGNSCRVQYGAENSENEKSARGRKAPLHAENMRKR